MKAAHAFLSCSVAALLVAGCGRPSGDAVSPGATPTPGASGTNLTAVMKDDQILRALGLDPARALSRVTQGKDGLSTEYSAGEDRVTITRSLVSGVSVIHGTQTWYLGKP